MIKCDTSIVLDSRTGRDMWCVFEHQAVLKAGEPPEVILVGATKLVDVYRMIEGRSNSEWASIFAGGGQVLIRIMALFTGKGEARKHAMQYMSTLRPMPRCNLVGYNLRGNARSIYCVNNQKTYRTQTEAAVDLGIHPSSISRHMRGEVSHAQGLKFIYASDVKDGALPENVDGRGRIYGDEG